MAEVNTGGGDGGGKHQKKRAKKMSTRIDMTPMVDLAFLLLTFFVLTSTFSKPKAMDLSTPDETGEDQKVNNAVTLLLSDKDKIFYYFGEFYLPGNDKGQPPTSIKATDFSSEGLHKILMDKNKWANDEIIKLKEKLRAKEIADTTFKRVAGTKKADKQALMAIIKTDDKATYKNVIDAVDELNICNVGKQAVVDIIPQEEELIKNFQK